MPACQRILRAVLLWALLLLPPVVAAQGTTGIEIPDILKLRRQGATASPEAAPIHEIPAMDAPVVDEEYMVGPGDVLGIQVLSSDPKDFSLAVTPEGYLILPGMGRVRVADSTLAWAARRVRAELGNFFPSADISVSLLSPRRVVVEVTGMVVHEGRYTISSIARVDRLLELANSPRSGEERSPEFAAQAEFARSNASDRGIVLRRRNGDARSVDLVRHTLLGDGSANPYLAEGDVVHVPKRSPLQKTLGIFGGVNRSGTFEYVQGDRLSFLLAMGLGLKSTADSSRVLLTRLSADAMEMESLRIDLVALLSGREEDPPVRPGDRLVVPERIETRLNYIVAVEGAVNAPGRYPITRRSTRLTDIIRAAGGFAPEAFVGGGSVIRPALSAGESPERQELEQLQSLRGGIGAQDSAYFLAESHLRMRGEPVTVDFHRLFVEGDSAADVVLQPYDVVQIPERQHTVYVFGQVRAPGHVALVHGEDVSYYVDRAGGFTEDARCGDVAIIKNGSRLWLSPDETVIDDGDFVWVPREVHYPLAHYIAVYAQIATILGVAATVALLIDNLSK